MILILYNSFVEKCFQCKAEHSRDFIVAQPTVQPMKQIETQKKSYKLTGRMCAKPECGGYLEHTIVNFGEKVTVPIWKQALAHAKKADLIEMYIDHA